MPEEEEEEEDMISSTSDNETPLKLACLCDLCKDSNEEVPEYSNDTLETGLR